MKINVEEIVESLKLLKNDDNSTKMEELKREAIELEGSIARRIANLKETYKRKRNTINEIERLKLEGEETTDFTRDIKALAEHETVKDIKVDGKIIYVYTDYIDIYDSEGNRFRGNKYRIVMDFDRMSVKIFGEDTDYCRASCWSNKDPHPHVSGYTGSPCLGDAGSMYSMNANEYEIYACYIVILNFLQQVNTDDTAGQNIYNWDCIDEDDNIIDNPYKGERFNCVVCERGFDTEDGQECPICEQMMCENCEEWIPSEERYVCGNCLSENYTYCDECGEYYKNENITGMGDYCYCDDCLGKCTTTCDECGNRIFNDDVHSFDGDYNDYCEECWIKEKEEREEEDCE